MGDRSWIPMGPWWLGNGSILPENSIPAATCTFHAKPERERRCPKDQESEEG